MGDSPAADDGYFPLDDFTKNGVLARPKPIHYNCQVALRYLRKIDNTYLPRITAVYLPGDLMAFDDSGNTQYTDKLMSFLTTKLTLNCVSLEVPDDMHMARGAEPGRYDWFCWQLHDKMIQAFKKGQPRMLRFFHPQQYPEASEALTVFDFYNTYAKIERMLMPEHQMLLSYIRSYQRSYQRSTPVEIAPGIESISKHSRYAEDLQAAWLHVGYQLDFDGEQREPAEGTVIRLRHVHRENPWDHKNSMFM